MRFITVVDDGVVRFVAVIGVVAALAAGNEDDGVVRTVVAIVVVDGAGLSALSGTTARNGAGSKLFLS